MSRREEGPLATWHRGIFASTGFRLPEKRGKLADGRVNLGSFREPPRMVDRPFAVMQCNMKTSRGQACHFTMGPTLTASKNQLRYVLQ